jgi:serine/threonine protein kinase
MTPNVRFAEREPPPEDALLEELVFAYLERRESEAQRVLAELCAEHAGLSERLRLRVDALQTAGLLSRPASAPAALPVDVPGQRLLAPIDTRRVGFEFRAVRARDGARSRVRLVPREIVGQADVLEALERDLTVARTLRHPGVAADFEWGQAASGWYWAAAEPPAHTLADALAQVELHAVDSLTALDLSRSFGRALGGTLGAHPDWPSACARFIARTSEVLARAHAHAHPHGALGPQTVALADGATPIVTGFGLAALEGRGPALCEPEFKSPERRAGRVHGASIADDVFALAALLHVLVTLRPPTPKPVNVLERWLARRLWADPRRFNRALPRSLARALERALHASPGRRPSTMADLRAELERAIARIGA